MSILICVLLLFFTLTYFHSEKIYLWILGPVHFVRNASLESTIKGYLWPRGFKAQELRRGSLQGTYPLKDASILALGKGIESLSDEKQKDFILQKLKIMNHSLFKLKMFLCLFYLPFLFLEKSFKGFEIIRSVTFFLFFPFLFLLNMALQKINNSIIDSFEGEFSFCETSADDRFLLNREKLFLKLYKL